LNRSSVGASHGGQGEACPSLPQSAVGAARKARRLPTPCKLSQSIEMRESRCRRRIKKGPSEFQRRRRPARHRDPWVGRMRTLRWSPVALVDQGHFVLSLRKKRLDAAPDKKSRDAAGPRLARASMARLRAVRTPGAIVVVCDRNRPTLSPSRCRRFALLGTIPLNSASASNADHPKANSHGLDRNRQKRAQHLLLYRDLPWEWAAGSAI
jgi:hypothetical protein